MRSLMSPTRSLLGNQSNTILLFLMLNFAHRMTTEETERYNQLYQDFYKDMYDQLVLVCDCPEKYNKFLQHLISISYVCFDGTYDQQLGGARYAVLWRDIQHSKVSVGPMHAVQKLSVMGQLTIFKSIAVGFIVCARCTLHSVASCLIMQRGATLQQQL